MIIPLFALLYLIIPLLLNHINYEKLLEGWTSKRPWIFHDIFQYIPIPPVCWLSHYKSPHHDGYLKRRGQDWRQVAVIMEDMMQLTVEADVITYSSDTRRRSIRKPYMGGS